MHDHCDGPLWGNLIIMEVAGVFLFLGPYAGLFSWGEFGC